MEPALLTVEQAAEALRMSRRHVCTLVAKGELGSVKLGRLRRITPRQLAEYVARAESASAPAA